MFDLNALHDHVERMEPHVRRQVMDANKALAHQFSLPLAERHEPYIRSKLRTVLAGFRSVGVLFAAGGHEPACGWPEPKPRVA